jgi:hypothetical protein
MFILSRNEVKVYYPATAEILLKICFCACHMFRRPLKSPRGTYNDFVLFTIPYKSPGDLGGASEKSVEQL